MTDGENIIGIVGGMGPEAGVNLLNYITKLTPATCDQEHLSTILMSLPSHISDRTQYLENMVGENPGIAIARIISKLEKVGANIIGIACNTAHSPQILQVVEAELKKQKSKAELVNMPFETCNFIKEKYPAVRRIGLLTTNGTYKAGLYVGLLEELGLEPILPDFDFQNNVIHKMVYDPCIGIKSLSNGRNEEIPRLVKKTLRFFKEKNADAILIGCTELSLVFDEQATNLLIVDASKILAQSLIDKCT